MNTNMKVTCAVCDSDRVKKIRKKFEAHYNQVPVAIENAEGSVVAGANLRDSQESRAFPGRDGESVWIG